MPQEAKDSTARGRERQIDQGAPVGSIIGIAVFLILLAAFLVWMFARGGETPEQRVMRELNEPVNPLPKGDPPPLAAAGRDLYEKQCASCHGPRLSGGEAPNLRARRYTPPRWEDQDLANVIYSGKGSMPAFREKVSAGELTALVAYIRWEQGIPFTAAPAEATPASSLSGGTSPVRPTS